MTESDIVCVATTPHETLVQQWRSALEAEGIECQVGALMTFWFDNKPGPQTDVWVHRANAHRAREILEHHAPGESPYLERLRAF